MKIMEKLDGDGLWARCARACGWVMMSSMSSQVVRMLRILMFTYLLVPLGDFLVWGIVWSVVVLLREFFDTGVIHALIQSPQGAQKKYLDTAWWINAGRNGCLIAVLVIGAPFVGQLYDKSQLVPLLRWCTLVLVFDGLASMGPVVLRKQLLFGKVAAMEAVANVVGFVVAICTARHWGGAKALVFAEVCVAGSRCVLSYVIDPYRPGLQFDREAARALLGYGLMAYLAALVNVAAMRADVLVLGSVATDEVGGYYVLGMMLVMAPCGMFALLSVTVGFPALSLVQDDLSAVRRGTCEIMKVGTLIAVPVFAVLGLLSYDIVRVMPEKYAGVGAALRWLSVFGMSMVLLRQMAVPLYAVRKVHWCVVRGVVNFVLLAGLIVPMYRRWGLVGACWATNIAIIVTNVLILVVLLRTLRWSWRQWLGDFAIVWRAWAGGGLAFAGAYVCVRMAGYDWTSSALTRCLLCGTGLIGYVITCLRHYHVGAKSPVENVSEQLAATE